MRRASLERPRTVRLWRSHRRFVADVIGLAAGRDLQPGRLRKGPRHGGCGRSRCWLCHGEKLARRPTLQEFRSAISHREWAEEYGLRCQHVRRP